jgi:uncharacterized protein (DUF1330 family)
VGEAQNQPFQLAFNPSWKIDFQGSRVTSDRGLLLVREEEGAFPNVSNRPERRTIVPFSSSKRKLRIRKMPAIVAEFGGEYLVRGGKAATLSGDWDPARVVIVDFESMEKFESLWTSPEYRAVAPLREWSAQTHAVVIEGADDGKAI